MILPVRRGGLDRQQRKYPFAPLREEKKESLAKKRRRKDQDPFAACLPQAGFAPLRLCAKKKECLAKKGSRKD
jgi:hypothetical protein